MSVFYSIFLLKNNNQKLLLYPFLLNIFPPCVYALRFLFISIQIIKLFFFNFQRMRKRQMPNWKEFSKYLLICLLEEGRKSERGWGKKRKGAGREGGKRGKKKIHALTYSPIFYDNKGELCSQDCNWSLLTWTAGAHLPELSLPAAYDLQWQEAWVRILVCMNINHST